MKKLNWSLLIGGIIIAVIIFIMIFPERLTHINPYVIEGVKSVVQKKGTLTLKGAPFPPSAENILGTDSLGRDILSLIIYGTRLTIELGVLVVFGRFLIAMPMGIAAGFGNSFCRSSINLFNLLFSAIPALIVSILVLKINFFLGLFKSQSIIAFVIVLTVVGWAKLAAVIRERVENILTQPFITGEKAIGKSELKIALENVLPHLSAELIVLFFMEIALALSMIMQLGIFGAYVGNLRLIADTDGAVATTMNISYEPEWASMLSSSMGYITTAPWTVLSPAVTFFISILGFNLLGEGLREKLQGKNSKFVIYFRRVFNLRIFTRKFLRTTAVVLSVVIVITAAGSIMNNYRDKTQAKEALSLADWQFKNQVLIGSEEAGYTADNLKKSLQNSGFMPLGQDYIQTYNIDRLYAMENYTFNIRNKDTAIDLAAGRDFSLEDCGDYSMEAGIYDASEADIFNLKDFAVFDNKLVLLDESVYSRNVIQEFAQRLGNESKALGVIDIIGSDDPLPSIISSKLSNKAFIYVTKSAARYFKNDSKVIFKIKSKSLTGVGRNVAGILPGNNSKLSKQAIIIGIGYNYAACDKDNTVNKLKMAIELAKRLHDSKGSGRSIIIAFWDGNLIDNYAGVRTYTEQPLYPLENTAVNVDLTNMAAKGDTLMINSQQVSIQKYFAWAFNHELQTNLNNYGIKIQKNTSKESIQEILARGPSLKEVLYYKGAVPTILTLPVPEGVTGEKNAIESNFVKAMIKTITKNNY